jgi:opacity protein-like surface antigen
MKKILVFLAAVLIFVPCITFSDVVTFKVGYFFPRAQSDLWQDEFYNMSFEKSNYQASNFGFGYEYFLSNQFSMVLNVEGYSKNRLGQYVDFVGISDVDGEWAYPLDFQEDFIPAHTFSVSITPIQLSLKIAPLGRRQKFIPYVGGGVGLYIWSVRIFGDLVDLSDPWVDLDYNVDIYPIVQVNAKEENKLRIGYHAFGGVMVPVANRISFEAEFKYNFAKGNLTEYFVGFEPFDLSSYQISVGLNYWF